MQQQHERNSDIERFLQSLNSEDNAEHDADSPKEEPPQPNTQPGAEEDIQETIHVYFVREETALQKDVRIIESTPPGRPQQHPDPAAYTTFLFALLLPLSCLAFQLYLVFNPPTVTVILVPRSQTVTLSGTLQLGRVVAPLTLSQSQTVPTTGKGHQDAKQAQGAITFYNGQFQMFRVPAGTMLTAPNGIQVQTDQDATIPPESQTIPPTFGQTTVPAHDVLPGTRGNIPTGEINQSCCAASILAQNTAPFHGGQNEWNFQTVAKSDIDTTAAPIKTALAQSMQGALQGQLKSHEQLHILPCTPTVASDHRPGAEATQVNVTVSETCSAVAYNIDAVQAQAQTFLANAALQQIRTGYSLFGQTHVTIIQATAPPHKKPVVLSFTSQGTWVYAVGKAEQEQIKSSIAGKTKQAAMHILQSLPGIEQASLAWSDDTKLPKDSNAIHLVFIFRT
jgi:hypothetical protein